MEILMMLKVYELHINQRTQEIESYDDEGKVEENIENEWCKASDVREEIRRLTELLEHHV